MADPRGFLKTTERVDRPKRPVPVRIMDFAEVQTRLADIDAWLADDRSSSL